MTDTIKENNLDPREDGIQHGIDDDPRGDAGKGAALGGMGGAIVGGLAGAMAGPVGIATGAAIGAVAGAVASGAIVAGVDAVDNDNNITGIGHGITPDKKDRVDLDNHAVISSDDVSSDATLPTRRIDAEGVDLVIPDDVDEETGGRVL